jgi:hypothetical protein
MGNNSIAVGMSLLPSEHLAVTALFSGRNAMYLTLYTVPFNAGTFWAGPSEELLIPCVWRGSPTLTERGNLQS